MSAIDAHVTRTEFDTRLDGKQDVLAVMPALLGRVSDELVEVDGRPGYVWVRIGNEEALGQARNRRVPNYYNLAVLVGYDTTSEEFQVLSVSQSAYLGAGYGVIPELEPHYYTHQWPAIGDPVGNGSDTVYISWRQMMGLRIHVDLRDDPPVPFRVFVGRAPLYRDGIGWLWVATQTMTLTDPPSSIPVVGARYTLMYLDADAILRRRDGNIKAVDDLGLDDVPDPLSGELPLAAIHLFVGQTTLQEDRDRQDIVDLRFPTTTIQSAENTDNRKLIEMGW